MFLISIPAGIAFVLAVFTFPGDAEAGILSTILSWFKGEETTAIVLNSQTMALLQAPVNPDPVSAKGGGDITIVADTALMSETGPSGSWADSGNSDGHISVYVVRKGDTVSQIAQMFGVSSNTVIWGNDLRGGLIHEGQTLVILPITGVRHEVVKGDTVASIAKKYKGDVEEILSYNGFTDSTTLSAGDIVIVPNGVIATPSYSSTPTAVLRGVGGPDYGDYYLFPVVGGARKTQGLHGYNGVDWASSPGTPIVAAAGGQVIVARHGGWNGGYGTYVVIEHSNGTQTLYAHLSGIAVIGGQQVVRGQVIGYMGSTGRSTGTHLHFEVRGARNPF